MTQAFETGLAIPPEAVRSGPQSARRNAPSAELMKGASKADEPARERLERLAAELNLMPPTGPAPANRSIPTAEDIQIKPRFAETEASLSKSGRNESGSSKLHIGTIDIQIVSTAAPPTRVLLRQDKPASSVQLSRGFTSTYGLRQG